MCTRRKFKIGVGSFNTLTHGYRPDCVAIAHDHSHAHIQMENELKTNRYTPIADYLMIDDMLVLRAHIYEMCSTTAINTNKRNDLSEFLPLKFAIHFLPFKSFSH